MPSRPALTRYLRALTCVKLGPRGTRDSVKIFRRGLPFLEAKGNLIRRGLNFVSFQASLDQFDVMFGDWMMNPAFPTAADGVDKLLDPAGNLTTIETGGYYFVPPHSDEFPAASLFAPSAQHKPKLGRVAVHKRFADETNPVRAERAGIDVSADRRCRRPDRC